MKTHWVFLASIFITGGQAQTATEAVLRSFNYFPQGVAPNGTMILDAAENLYGTTIEGGAANFGTVFVRQESGTYKLLHSFKGGADGSGPYAGVILDAAGNLYGTTSAGGTSNLGVVYKLSPSGDETILHTFTGGADGATPYAAVVLDGAGNLYGTTYAGGGSNKGVVYKLSPSGLETLLYTFTGLTDGGNPYAGVILDPAGNLYGTASTNYDEAGIVYMLSPSGQQTVLYASLSNVAAGLVRDSEGNLYGVDAYQVYKISASGQFTRLTILNSGLTGGLPTASLTLDAAGNLYGTSGPKGSPGGTYAPYGAIFQVTPSGQLTILNDFEGAQAEYCPGGLGNPGVALDGAGNIYADSSYIGVCGGLIEIGAGKTKILDLYQPAAGGSTPEGGVTADASGNLYGTTFRGGAANAGVLYKLDSDGETVLPLPLYSFGSIVAVDKQGNLYVTGAPAATANDNIYKLTPAGQSTILYTFTGGIDGTGSEGVTLGAGGEVYGTSFGGTSGPLVFRLGAGGRLIVLHAFSGFDESGPVDPQLTLDTAGNIYGATSTGSIFRLNRFGEETVLWQFVYTGDPLSGVIRDAKGNLYGTTSVYEPYLGSIFKLSANGDFTVLYNFVAGPTGSGPIGGLAMDSAGNLFGTAASGGDVSCVPFPDASLAGCGVVFELDTQGTYTVLHTFTGGSDGAYPVAPVTLDQRGNLYGTTEYGGSGNSGVVYKVTRQ